MTITPPLKWAGGKRWLAPFLLPDLTHLLSTSTLFEPFCGGLGMALSLLPPKALLNDGNPHVINLYSQIAAHGLVIPEDICIHTKEAYYARREEFNQLIRTNPNTVRCAALFYYLNRTCFNGLCRFNRKGEFNVPYGDYKQINYRTDFTDLQPIFANWEFTCSDFRAVCPAPDGILYLDPPYVEGFVGYTGGTFTWLDQEAVCIYAAKHPGPVIVSNKATEMILDLYRYEDFKLYTVKAPRRVNNTGDRTPVEEMVATRHLPTLTHPDFTVITG